MTIGATIAEAMAADWADPHPLAGVRVVATEKALGEVTRPTALIRHKGITRTEGAPLSHRDVGLLMTLISSHTDLDRAADQLEALVDEALTWLDTRYRHEGATLVDYGPRLAYDIPFTVIAAKD